MSGRNTGCLREGGVRWQGKGRRKIFVLHPLNLSFSGVGFFWGVENVIVLGIELHPKPFLYVSETGSHSIS
jgi:hypothetical protein